MFLHFKQEAAQFLYGGTSVKLSAAAPCRWRRALFCPLMTHTIFFMFSAYNFVPFSCQSHLLLCAMCLSLCMKNARCGGLPCLWISVFGFCFFLFPLLMCFELTVFNSVQTEYLVSWDTRIVTLLSECGPKDCNWRQRWERTSLCIHLDPIDIL